MEIKEKDELPRRMTGLIWSMAGAGKTTLLSSLPGKVLFVMLDPDGKDSIPEGMDYSILDLSGLEDGETVRAVKDKVPSMIASLSDATASVVVDSLTILAQRGLNYAITQKIGGSPKFIPTIETPGLSAYGARRQYITHTVSNILRATAKKGFNCFFTTHQADGETNDNGDIIKYTMMLGGKAVNDAALQMSEVWWLREYEGKRFIAVRNCRMREPMKTRMFDATKSPEFEIKFNPELGKDQLHSLETFYKLWLAQGRRKLPLPDTAEYKKLYEDMMKSE